MEYYYSSEPREARILISLVKKGDFSLKFQFLFHPLKYVYTAL